MTIWASDEICWVVASFIALSLHVAGLLWIEPDRSRSTVELDRFSENVVVMLDPGSANPGELVTFVEEPRGGAAQLPGPVAGVRNVNDIDSVVNKGVESITQPNSEIDTAASITAPQVHGTSQTGESVTQITKIDEVQTNRVRSDSQVVESITPATLVEGSKQAAAIDSVHAQAASPVEAVAEIVSPTISLGEPVEAKVKDVTSSVSISPDSSAPEVAASDPVTGESIEVGATIPVVSVTLSPDTSVSEVITPDPVFGESNLVALSDAVDVDVEGPEPIVDAGNAPVHGALEQAPVVKIEQQGRDSSVLDLVLELAAVEAVTVTDQNPSADTPKVVEAEVVEVPAEQQVARVYTLDDLQRRQPGGRGVVAGYAGQLKGWLQENMHYPRAARLAGQEGKAVVRFVIDRSGMVLSIQLEQVSGHMLLDREAVEMIERANPFPAMPAEMGGEELQLRVPIAFQIKDQSKIKQIPPIDLQ